MQPPDRDIEQVDYGIGYKGVLSPQQHLTLKVEGGVLAIAVSLLALGGVVVAAILIPEIIEARAEQAAAPGVAKAQYAERDARVALDKLTYIQSELARKGIYISQDGH